MRMGPHACGLRRCAAPRGGAIRALGPPGGANARIHPVAQARARRIAGFTLVELVVALALLALMSAVMFGSLSMAGRTWDGGETKVGEVSAMRQAQEFLREQLSAEYPLRLRKVAELPMLFAGERDELRYTAALPPRVVDGGVYYFRLAVAKSGDKSQLILERVIPDASALQEPEFRDAEHSVLADGIAELHVSYFGRDPDAADTDAPTWRDRWSDRQRLPLLVRIEVQPEKGAPWPVLVVEPRRAPEAGCPSYDPARNRCGSVG